MQPRSFPNTTGKWFLSIRWHAKEHVSISATSRRKIQTPWKADPHVSLHPRRQAVSTFGYGRRVLALGVAELSIVGCGFTSLKFPTPDADAASFATMRSPLYTSILLSL
jgi:hypothetical protein